MPKKKLQFRGFLTNTDNSILNLKLDHNFKIRVLSDTEAYTFISEAENIQLKQAGNKLFIQYPCLNSYEKKAYVIDNFLETEVNPGEICIFNDTAKFDNELVHGYLNPTLQLMRLFKEGNIRMPLTYFYFIRDGKTISPIRIGAGPSISRGLYHLDDSDVIELRTFLSTTKLPFKEEFLQLALENYDLSYKIFNRALSFLTLMISLETLFNPGEHEVRYQISRNAAVLLGSNREESKKIFHDIKKLYVKRSKIVHSGKSKNVEKEDVPKLRHYVREAIKKMYKRQKNKKMLLEELNYSGF